MREEGAAVIKTKQIFVSSLNGGINEFPQRDVQKMEKGSHGCSWHRILNFEARSDAKMNKSNGFYNDYDNDADDGNVDNMWKTMTGISGRMMERADNMVKQLNLYAFQIQNPANAWILREKIKRLNCGRFVYHPPIFRRGLCHQCVKLNGDKDFPCVRVNVSVDTTGRPMLGETEKLIWIPMVNKAEFNPKMVPTRSAPSPPPPLSLTLSLYLNWN